MRQKSHNIFSKELIKIPGKKTERAIWHEPLIHYFNPQAGPISGDYPTEKLTYDELEAMRLKHLENKSQKEGADLMSISQSTFYRTLERAHRKITNALVDGKSIQLILGHSRTYTYGYGCMECNYEFYPDKKTIEDKGKMLPLDGIQCKNPNCNSPDVYRLLREVGEPKLLDTKKCSENN